MDHSLGREKLVRNLLDHLSQGTSAVVAGGPGMGKTTLLQQTARSMLDGVCSVSIDLRKNQPGDIAQRIPNGRDPVILLLDSCEVLLPDPLPFVNEIFHLCSQSGRNVPAMVWAGAVPWGEWAMANRSEFSGPIRYYPLIVLPPKEARPFLRHHLPKEVSSSEIERLLDIAGGHPYLLSQMLKQADVKCDSFFAELWNAAGSLTEHAVLNHLIQAEAWVPLVDLRDEDGDKLPKSILDRLAILGLINRTLVEGEAAAKAISPLLGDWARRTGHSNG